MSIEYVPPSLRSIQRWADEGCQQLAQRDERFADPQVASGLASFMHALLAAYARQLNARPVDTHED